MSKITLQMDMNNRKYCLLFFLYKWTDLNGSAFERLSSHPCPYKAGFSTLWMRHISVCHRWGVHFLCLISMAQSWWKLFETLHAYFLPSRLLFLWFPFLRDKPGSTFYIQCASEWNETTSLSVITLITILAIKIFWVVIALLAPYKH